LELKRFKLGFKNCTSKKSPSARAVAAMAGPGGGHGGPGPGLEAYVTGRTDKRPCQD
jgi:hypothetical protein